MQEKAILGYHFSNTRLVKIKSFVNVFLKRVWQNCHSFIAGMSILDTSFMESSSNNILRHFSSRSLFYSLHAFVGIDLSSGLLVSNNRRLETA